MRRLKPALLPLLFVSCLVYQVTPGLAETGMASHYSTHDHDQTGTRTASGIPLRNNAMTAAHKSLPLGSKVKVTNKRNGRSVVVTITDRGPYTKGRIIDLTTGAAQAIGMGGLASVEVSRL